MIVVLTTSVFASSVSTTETSNGFEVRYDIDQPGWYLLPTEATFSKPIMNPSTTVFDALAQYKFFQSPLTLSVEPCKQRVKNKLVCERREEVVKNNANLLAYNAAWSYYTRPTSATFHYDNNLLFGGYDNGMLRKGWNLITFPPHIAMGKAYPGNCAVMRAYVWDVDQQGWNAISLHDLQNDYSSLSGKGMAVKVPYDCVLVHAKSNYALPEPQLPLMHGIE